MGSLQQAIKTGEVARIYAVHARLIGHIYGNERHNVQQSPEIQKSVIGFIGSREQYIGVEKYPQRIRHSSIWTLLLSVAFR